MATTSKFSLKLLIDKSHGRVLFAEAGKDFVDFLFQIFSLPLGSVVSLLSKGGGMVGCLGKLYKSIENLSDTYMQPGAEKEDVLNPKTFNNPRNAPFLLPSSSSSPKGPVLYSCSNRNNVSSSFSNPDGSSNPNIEPSFSFGPAHSSNRNNLSSSFSSPASAYCHEYVSDDPLAICPKCNVKLNRPLSYVPPAPGKAVAKREECGYVKGVVTYMIMDDLEVKPMSTISSISMLNNFNVKDMTALEEKQVRMGMDEGLKLLKASLQSVTVLTDVFLGNREQRGLKYRFDLS